MTVFYINRERNNMKKPGLWASSTGVHTIARVSKGKLGHLEELEEMLI